MTTDNLQSTLDAALKRHAIPGAQVGILADGETTVAVAGVVTAGEAQPVRVDHRFNLGSIAKVLTAHLVMTRVAQGDFTLETRIADLLPDFRTADVAASNTLTIFHLLTHTSGLFGEHEPAAGASEPFYALAPQLTQPGEVFSYCNIGFSILGRVIEETAGRLWRDCVEREICAPLGLMQIDLDASVDDDRWVSGHQPLSSGEGLRIGVRAKGPAFQAPSGATAIASVPDILIYAAHMIACSHGEATDPLIDRAVVREMWRRQVDATPSTDGWGLGWRRYSWSDLEVVGHDGAMPGQTSFLRIAPARRAAIAMLCNHEDGSALFGELERAVFGPLVGASPAPWPAAIMSAAPRLEDYVGAYRRPDATLSFRIDGERLIGDVRSTDENGAPLRAGGYVLSPVAKDRFLARGPDLGAGRAVAFLRDRNGAARYVTSGVRTYVRDDLATGALQQGER